MEEFQAENAAQAKSQTRGEYECLGNNSKSLGTAGV